MNTSIGKDMVMIIKNDFVTNSSSTCFIVSIPEKFEVSDEEIQNTLQKTFEDFYDPEELETSFTEFVEIVREYIESLKCGECVYEYDIEYDACFVYDVIEKILENNSFILTSLDIHSDGNNHMVGISIETIKKCLLQHIDSFNIKVRHENEK
jgi:hypothetical protein